MKWIKKQGIVKDYITDLYPIPPRTSSAHIWAHKIIILILMLLLMNGLDIKYSIILLYDINKFISRYRFSQIIRLITLLIISEQQTITRLIITAID